MGVMMSAGVNRAQKRRIRHRRIRKKVAGLPQRPRLCVFRSHKHLYVQLIDDLAGKTLRGWSTQDERLKHLRRWGTVAAAKVLGTVVAADALKQGAARVVFDRGGYPYHGRVQALAEALRAGGIQV
ncbi:MAG: 50S ribosomal protein L18 [Candidatus Omnitrophica bacterium]|nr:50S ribosomal protein L18 [Candidatus Omnitrophota bacterium]